MASHIDPSVSRNVHALSIKREPTRKQARTSGLVGIDAEPMTAQSSQLGQRSALETMLVSEGGLK
jgi:hypothetical protein